MYSTYIKLGEQTLLQLLQSETSIRHTSKVKAINTSSGINTFQCVKRSSGSPEQNFNAGLFCSLISPKHVQQCLVHGRLSINIHWKNNYTYESPLHKFGNIQVLISLNRLTMVENIYTNYSASFKLQWIIFLLLFRKICSK